MGNVNFFKISALYIKSASPVKLDLSYKSNVDTSEKLGKELLTTLPSK